MNLVLLGPPGAGKGTQAAKLSKAFGLRHLSSGDVLRAERKKGSELGKRVTGYMDSGALVPDEIIIEVILEQLKSNEGFEGFLLDGFPRTGSQAESLDAALAKRGQKVDQVLSVVVPDEEIVDRITGRRICSTCNAVYHVRHRPPARDNVCDRDGTQLVHRPDDTREVIEQRLAAYHAQTKPLEAYYRGKGLLVEADGTKDVDTVFAALQQMVKQRVQ
jgi:adenylate kinase